MKANESTMLRFIGGADKKFIIPVYQRPYSWKKENCVRLMKDLKDVYKHNYESHFFGSIVFVSQNNGVCEEYTIIDGQQRITTISLLLLAIRNYIINENVDININPDKIRNIYLTDEFSDYEKKLKLKLVQGDDEAYDNLIEDKSPIENTNITVNYNYFYNEISNMNAVEIEKLNNAISKLTIVSISLRPQHGDDPQLIFESLNSTGLELEQSDKIRNFVLMRMEGRKQERFYRKYWEQLEKIVTRDEMNKFIRYYLAVKTRRLFMEKNLYIEFKHYKNNCDKPIESVLSDMIEYAGYYKIINNPLNSGHSCSEILNRIKKLEIKTCIPLIMDLFRANSQDKLSDTEMNKALEIIENYIIRREICGLQSNALNKIFVQLGSDIEGDMNMNISYFDAFKYEIMKKSGKSRFPNNNDFFEKFMVYDLYNAKPAIKKYIFERLENHENKEIVDVEKLVNKGVLTIEHIMPQTMNDEWKISIGDNWELVHSKYKDTIGNLTLTAYNSEYSNSSFNIKKTMPKKGFNFSKLSLNDYIKSCKKWGENEITERARILFEEAVEIWWMPENRVKIEKEDAEWFDWDEDIDITNKKIVQVIVLDKVVSTTDVTSAYKIIHETLYDINPIIYHNNSFPWFKESVGNTKRFYRIGKSAYIKVDDNSQDKLYTIKTMADLFGLAQHDISILVQDKKTEE